MTMRDNIESLKATFSNPILSTPKLAASAALLGLGVVLLTLGFSFGLIPIAMHAPAAKPSLLYIVSGLGAVGLVLALSTLSAQVGALETDADRMEEPEKSKNLYGV